MRFTCYEFSSWLSDRENFFLTKLFQRYIAIKYIYGDDKMAYFSAVELRDILGRRAVESSLQKLKDLGFIEEHIYGETVYGKPMKCFIPLKTDYKKSILMTKFISAYYENKRKTLSRVANIVYKTISHSSIDITTDEYFECLKTAYFDYLEKPDKKQKLSKEDYFAEMSNLLLEINNFNSCNKNEKVDYLTEDKFGNRLHSIFTRLPKVIRKDFVKLKGESTVEIDLVQSQPSFLAKILEKRIGKNSFTDAIKRGDDVYSMLSPNNRAKGKSLMFFILFGEFVSKQFKAVFPDVVDEIKKIKTTPIKENPSSKVYSNLAYLLQQEESRIFRELWALLRKANIEFIPIHDSILVPISLKDKALDIMTNYLNTKLNNPKITLD